MLSSVWGRALEGAKHIHVGLATQREDCMRPGAWHDLRSNTAPAQTNRAKRTALIVEDNPRLRKMMSAHMARMGFDVLAASHFAAALAHLESETLVMACIDIGLPTESGYELCEHIRGMLGLKFLPIMVTSEFGSPEYVAYAEKAGADAFLLKPFSMSELGANVAALLEGVRPGAAHVFQPAARRSNDRIDNHGQIAGNGSERRPAWRAAANLHTL
jgi:DNA-binding response OmpR family regulator